MESLNRYFGEILSAVSTPFISAVNVSQEKQNLHPILPETSGQLALAISSGIQVDV